MIEKCYNMEIRWLRKTAEKRKWLRNEGRTNNRRKEELKQRQGLPQVSILIRHKALCRSVTGLSSMNRYPQVLLNYHISYPCLSVLKIIT